MDWRHRVGRADVEAKQQQQRFASACRAWSFAQPVVVNVTLPSVKGGGEQSFRCVSWIARLFHVPSDVVTAFIHVSTPAGRGHESIGVIPRSQPDSCSTYAYNNVRGEQSFRCVSDTGNRRSTGIIWYYCHVKCIMEVKSRRRDAAAIVRPPREVPTCLFFLVRLFEQYTQRAFHLVFLSSFSLLPPFFFHRDASLATAVANENAAQPSVDVVVGAAAAETRTSSTRPHAFLRWEYNGGRLFVRNGDTRDEWAEEERRPPSGPHH